MYSTGELADHFRNLGITPGETIMLHASVRSVGEDAGGPDQIHLALKSVLRFLLLDGRVLPPGSGQDAVNLLHYVEHVAMFQTSGSSSRMVSGHGAIWRNSIPPMTAFMRTDPSEEHREPRRRRSHDRTQHVAGAGYTCAATSCSKSTSADRLPNRRARLANPR